MGFFASLINSMPSAVAQGLIWGIMAIGVYTNLPHPGCGRFDGGRLSWYRRCGLRCYGA